MCQPRSVKLIWVYIEPGFNPAVSIPTPQINCQNLKAILTKGPTKQANTHWGQNPKPKCAVRYKDDLEVKGQTQGKDVRFYIKSKPKNLRGGHGGRVVTLSTPTSEPGVRFLARPQVGKLVVACRWSAVYSTEP